MLDDPKQEGESLLSSRTLPQEAEMLIIGGGAIGTQCALKLAEADVHGIVIVEMGDFPNGSSLRSAAAVRTAFEHPTNIALATLGVQTMRDFEQRTGCRERVVSFNGYLYPAYTRTGERRTRERVSDVKEAGGNVELLGARQAMARFPYLQEEELRVAAFYPDAGFAIPALLVRETLEAAKRQGVEAFSGTCVQQISNNTQSGRWMVNTNRGVIRPRLIINACGAWSARMARFIGRDLDVYPIRRHLYFAHRREQGVFTADELRTMPFICGGTGAYIRPEHLLNGNGDFDPTDEAIMMGWASMPNARNPAHYLSIDFEDAEQDRIGDPFFNRTNVDGYGARMQRECAKFLPRLGEAGVGIRHQSCGLYEMTPDHMPIIGFDPDHASAGRPRFLHCAGFNGHGIMMSGGAAVAVTELITFGKIRSIPNPERLAVERDYSGHWDSTTI